VRGEQRFDGRESPVLITTPERQRIGGPRRTRRPTSPRGHRRLVVRGWASLRGRARRWELS